MQSPWLTQMPDKTVYLGAAHPPLLSDLLAKDPNRAFVHEIYIHIYRFVHDSCIYKIKRRSRTHTLRKKLSPFRPGALPNSFSSRPCAVIKKCLLGLFLRLRSCKIYSLWSRGSRLERLKRKFTPMRLHCGEKWLPNCISIKANVWSHNIRVKLGYANEYHQDEELKLKTKLGQKSIWSWMESRCNTRCIWGTIWDLQASPHGL